ncbi:MAG: hypothetical protein ACRC7G_14905, partial [Beijerinckiaceae bacterium]
RFSDSVGGKSEIDRLLPKYAKAATHGVPRLVIRDLDRDASCPGELVARLVPDKPNELCLRIAVREIESWLIADVEAFANLIPIRKSELPLNTDDIADPKRLILDAVRRRGGKSLQRQLLSRSGEQAFEGPEYASFMQRFATDCWDASKAIRDGRSASLTRSATRIEQFIRSLT